MRRVQPRCMNSYSSADNVDSRPAAAADTIDCRLSDLLGRSDLRNHKWKDFEIDELPESGGLCGRLAE